MTYLQTAKKTPDAIIALGSAPVGLLLSSGAVVAGTTEYPEGATMRWTPDCPLVMGMVLIEPSGGVALKSECLRYHAYGNVLQAEAGVVRISSQPQLVWHQTVRAPAPAPRRGALIPSAIGAATLRKARRARAFLRAVPESTYVVEDDPTDEL